jgi:hypothetical protein
VEVTVTCIERKGSLGEFGDQYTHSVYAIRRESRRVGVAVDGDAAILGYHLDRREHCLQATAWSVDALE